MSEFKQIRFNLQFHNGDRVIPVRSLTDLENNLNLDDLYEYFCAGQLSRWLRVSGEIDKADKIAGISKRGDIKSNLEEILKVLALDLPEDEISSAVDSYLFPKKIEESRKREQALCKKVNELVMVNFANYNQLLKDIIASAENFSEVKSKVRGMLKSYPEQFKLDYMRFYSVMSQKCPLAVFVILMDPDWKKYFTVSENADDLFLGPLAEVFEETNSPKTIAANFQNLLGSFLKVSKSNGNLTCNIAGVNMADSYVFLNSAIREVDYAKSGGEWQDVLESDKKVMIVYCGENVTVRPYHNHNEQKKGSELPPFAVLDGLEFRSPAESKDSASTLLYMEV